MYADVFAAILVGGTGSRLGGADKAMLRGPDGTPLLERLVATLAPAVCEVVLIGRAGQRYDVGCRQLEDTRPASGPLAGLDAALTAEIAPWCFLVACDMPAVGVELLELLAARRRDHTCVVVPRIDDRLEPTAALYAASCRHAIRAALDAGRRAVHRVVLELAHEAVEVPRELRAQLANINTPEDLAAAGARRT